MPSDRYEPLPGFTQMPRWLWRKASRPVRVLVLVVAFTAVAGTAIALPKFNANNEKRAAAEAKASAEAKERLIAEMIAEQKPVLGETDPSDRVAAAAALKTAIQADAEKRVAAGDLDGPIRGVECERFPRTVGDPLPELDPSVRDGRYSCVAVTVEFKRSAKVQGGLIGHPYRALLHFDTGRYGFCKVAPRLEMVRNQRVTTPPECGG